MNRGKKVIILLIIFTLGLFINLKFLSAINYEINENFDDDKFLELLTYDKETTKERVFIKDSKLINKFDGSSPYTRILFGAQDKASNATLEFDFTPIYNNKEYAIINFNFRHWDQASTYKFEVKENDMKLFRYEYNLDAPVLLDELNMGFKDKIKVHVKLYMNGWYKAVFVDGEKLLETSESSLATGFFGIETWESGYELDNLKLTYDKLDEDLNIPSLKQAKINAVKDFKNLYDEKYFKDSEIEALNTLALNLEKEIKDLMKTEAVLATYENYKREALKIVQKTLNDTIKKYVGRIKNYVSLSKYSGENQNQVKSLIDEYKALIQTKETFKEIEDCYNEFILKIDLIKSNDDLNPDLLNKFKNEAINRVKTYVSLDLYSKLNQEVLKSLYKNFETEVSKLETSKLVTRLMNEYLIKIEEVLTIEEENSALLKEEINKALNELKNHLDKNNGYTVRAKKEIDLIIKEQETLFKEASSIENLNVIKQEAFKLLDAVLTFKEEFKEGYKETFSDWSFLDNAISLRSEEDYDIVNNTLKQLRQNEVNETRVMFGGAPMWKNFTLELELKPTYLNPDYSWGKVVFRAKNNDSKEAYIFNYKNNIAWLSKMDKEGKEDMLDCVNFGFEDLINYKVKIVAFEENLMVFVNNVKILETKDSTYEEGAFGFITWQTGFIIKNLKVSSEVSKEDVAEKRLSFKEKFDFEDGKTTDLIGSRGISVVTDPYNQNNKVLSNKNYNYTRMLFGDARYQNFILNFEIIPIGLEAPEQLIKFIIRSNGWEGNSYYIELEKSSIAIYSNVNERKKELAHMPFEFISTARYEIEIRALDDRIAFYIQGNKIFDVNDASYNTYGSAFLEMGFTGIQTWNAPYMVDNYEIKEMNEWLAEPRAEAYPKGQLILISNLTNDLETIDLKKGEEGKLNLSYLPSNANVNFKYEVSDESIISVDSEGVIKALKGGKAVITIKELNSGLETTVNVSVKETKKGCGGAISLGLVGSISLLGLAFYLKRKKED